MNLVRITMTVNLTLIVIAVNAFAMSSGTVIFALKKVFTLREMLVFIMFIAMLISSFQSARKLLLQVDQL